jgi:hypothetical protein
LQLLMKFFISIISDYIALLISMVAKAWRYQKGLPQQRKLMYGMVFLNLLLLFFSFLMVHFIAYWCCTIIYRNNNAVRQIAWIPTR